MDNQEKIKKVCDYVKHTLLEKNNLYGDAALKPLGVFNKQPASNSILIRLDDKLNRIKNIDEPRKNDIFDMIGYLTLYCVSKGWDNFNDQID